jgi:hypothetical protein
MCHGCALLTRGFKAYHCCSTCLVTASDFSDGRCPTSGTRMSPTCARRAGEHPRNDRKYSQISGNTSPTSSREPVCDRHPIFRIANLIRPDAFHQSQRPADSRCWYWWGNNAPSRNLGDCLARLSCQVSLLWRTFSSDHCHTAHFESRRQALAVW